MTWNYTPPRHAAPPQIDDGVYLAVTYKDEKAVFIISGMNYRGWRILDKLAINPAEIDRWMKWPEEEI